MERTQIQLTEPQAEALRRLSAQEGRSIADLIREAVDRLLQGRNPGRSREEIRARALAAVGRFRGGPKDLGVNHDRYLGDAFGH